jgi:hypothetical protein
MRIRLALILAGAVLAILAIYLLRPSTLVPEPFAGPPVKSAPRIEEQMRESLQPPPETATPLPQATAPEPQLAPRLELSRGKLAWEEKIESVTNATDLSNTAKARRLLAMLPVLPEHGLATAAEEAVTRLPDADYNAVGLPVVVNPQTHGMAESVLFADLMERPDAITLPALLRIAQIPQHPYAPYAHDNLELLLGKNFGSDWLMWDAEIRRSLAAEKAAR